MAEMTLIICFGDEQMLSKNSDHFSYGPERPLLTMKKPISPDKEKTAARH
ncbi:hypothetical protein ACFS5N_10585 [Mucilaginibacter ximonensis]|uniref:Uncharacterized protein n=1 Tax=Mucilaginibacter ximonensis TaxID=538021 RepID=A0ABW5YD62_9SPHI